MYTQATPEIKDKHFIMTYQLADLFTGKGLDDLQAIGVTTKQIDHLEDDGAYCGEYCLDGVSYTIEDECGYAQTCETEVVDGEVENFFQFSNTAEIWLTHSAGYRGAGNYEAIVKQNDQVYLIDIVSEGMVYLLEPINK